MRIRWLTYICLLIIINFHCQNPYSVDNELNPNVIIVIADDQGWGDLGIHGNQNISTPNLDRLSISGATFDHFYVCPVCSPTRAEILTGRYHVRGGVYATSTGGERLDLDEKTIAEYFHEAGYKTAAFGKWHNGMQYPYHPNARGFEEFYGFCSGHWGHYFSPMLEHNGKLVKGNGYLTDDFTDHALQFIEESVDASFFLYLAFNTPHSPMQVPDRWWSKYAHREISMYHQDSLKEDLVHTKAALAMCENIDWNVGRIQGKLTELNISQNTIVVYLSDNGPNGWRWNGRMKGIKGWTDEGGTRSPLFLQWSGKITPGIHIPQIASAIDLLPTLTGLAGISINPVNQLDGLDLQSLLWNQSEDWPDRNLFHYWRGKISIRNQNYRLDFENNLFNITNDPGQLENIAQKFPELTNSMITARRQWELEVLSELPSEDHRPFPVGHPDYKFTQIPARDGKAHGNIKRSSRYPNCTYFSNFKSPGDSVTWDIEVLEDGSYQVSIYYTCTPENVGSSFAISAGSSLITGEITHAHDPPLMGKEADRHPRIEGYVKDFRQLDVGPVELEVGRQTLVLEPIYVPGEDMMDFRLMMFTRN